MNHYLITVTSKLTLTQWERLIKYATRHRDDIAIDPLAVICAGRTGQFAPAHNDVEPEVLALHLRLVARADFDYTIDSLT